MRNSVLLVTVLAFICADWAIAAPVPVGTARKSLVSGSADTLTPVRARKRRVRRVQRIPASHVMAAPPAASSPAAVAPRPAPPPLWSPIPDALPSPPPPARF